MPRSLPAIDCLPHALYRAAQVREFDRIAIQEYRIPGATLMERAGQAVFDLLSSRWPQVDEITVVCGVGNNAGDGYVIARLAREANWRVRVLQLGNPERLQGDALAMARAWSALGGELEPFTRLPVQTGLIVDAVLGTGLERPVAGAWGEALEQINRHPAPVVAVDIPSGLNSDTGRVMGVAVHADLTVSFIALKQGMFSGDGPAYCGEIRYDALQVPARIFSRQILSARRLDWAAQSRMLQPRSRSAHKGDFGHALVIGGEQGFTGALRLAGEAAARSGAGLVSLATRPDHAAFAGIACPELMCHGVADGPALEPLLERATVVVIGPGLGQSRWARSLLDAVVASRIRLVVDADALNLLAADPQRRDDWVLTPHPGEAARLLGVTSRDIQADRFSSVQQLQERYGGVCVLKGAGSLILGGSPRPVGVCSEGNPGMATGGMGDLLTGIIAGLMAQGMEAEEAACLGSCVHGAAADKAAELGERGLIATDLMPQLRPLLNPHN